MKRKTLLLLAFILLPAYSIEVELIPSSLPTEFHFIFSAVKKQISSQELYDKCTELENNLLSVPKKYTFYVIKSEIYKSILDYEYDSYTPSIALNANVLEQMKRKLTLNEGSYTKVSHWIFRSFLSDLNFRIKNNQLFEKGPENKFLRPWFKHMIQKTPEEFNQLTSEISLSIFNRIVLFSKTFTKNSFFTPEQTQIKFFKFDQEKTALSEESNSSQTKTLEQIIPTEEELSAEIDKIEKSINPTSPTWTPKN